MQTVLTEDRPTDSDKINNHHSLKYNFMVHMDTKANQSLSDMSQNLFHYNNAQQATANLIDLSAVIDTLVLQMIEIKLNIEKESLVPPISQSISDSRIKEMLDVSLMLDWRRSISNSNSVEEIITVLRSAGLTTIAKRLTDLKEITDEESDGNPINIESLRIAARFIMENIIENTWMPNPEITVSYEGLIYLRLQSGLKDTLGMKFLPSTSIRFTAIMHNPSLNSKRWSVSGFMSSDDMLRTVKPFIDKLQS